MHNEPHLSFSYEKTADEIKEKAATKLTSLTSKIKERLARISRLREEYSIDDAALIRLLTEARRSSSYSNHTFSYLASTPLYGSSTESKMEERTIGAGVVQNILTENDLIDSERASVKKLELILRNLRPLMRHVKDKGWTPHEYFPVSEDALDYLGF